VSPSGSPVDYPVATAGGRTYQFRYSKSAHFQLEAWGFELRPDRSIPALAWAAAMAGSGDAAGNWRSAAFRTPVEFVDTIGPDEDLAPLYAAVQEALKKVAPAATVTLNAKPASDTAAN
jgi:1-acyl-sn-glycerol-3-phosphate acyltransferase